MRIFKKILNLRTFACRSIKTLNNTSFQKSAVITDDHIIKSAYSYPIPDLTIDELLLQNVDRWSNKTSVVCAETNRSFTYNEVRKDSDKLSQAFCAKLGLKKGDVITFFLPNVPECIKVFLGAFKVGLIVSAINPSYTTDEIAQQLKDSSPKLIITLVQSYNLIKKATEKIQTNTHIPVVTIKHHTTDVTPGGTIDFKELCEYNGPRVTLNRPSPNDQALLLYSSGTSGLPKGVNLLHRNIVANLVQTQHRSITIIADTTDSHQDVLPMILPLYHCYGIVQIMFNAFSLGCKSVSLPKYTPSACLDMLEKYPGNIFFLVPPILLMLTNNENAQRKHLEQMRYIVSGAAPLGSSDSKKFQEKFEDIFTFFQYYGLTETGPLSHAPRLDREYISGSVGTNIPMVDCRIVSVDNDTKNLGPNQDGHLLIKGPNVMAGYYNNPKATEEAIDKDGWFKTGDVAHYDENGLIFITDRIKELIKVKGLQVAPAELEALIRSHALVDDVAVTSVPHSLNGEAPKAFVVPRAESKLRPEEIQDYVKENAANHKHLTGGVVFVNSIPKTPSGKILRRKLREI